MFWVEIRDDCQFPDAYCTMSIIPLRFSHTTGIADYFEQRRADGCNSFLNREK